MRVGARALACGRGTEWNDSGYRGSKFGPYDLLARQVVVWGASGQARAGVARLAIVSRVTPDLRSTWSPRIRVCGRRLSTFSTILHAGGSPAATSWVG